MFQAARPSWQNPRIFSTLLLVFLAGAAVGALVMRIGLHEALHRSHSSINEAALSYNRLVTDLDLTPDQCKQLKTILDDYTRYHEDLEAQLDDWRATGHNQILKILNTKQRARFEKISTEVR